MEKFRYGPLVYITAGMEDHEGNYYWNGSPPVGYDSDGVPIDSKGMQCLDISCPLHPSWSPPDIELIFNYALGVSIPSLDFTRSWFENNYLEISDLQLKKIILKWLRRSCKHSEYVAILKKYSSVEEIMEAVWPDETTS